MGLPGQAGGEALKNLLYGVANPSGKLAETWPVKYGDCPSASYYPQRDGQYREGYMLDTVTMTRPMLMCVGSSVLAELHGVYLLGPNHRRRKCLNYGDERWTYAGAEVVQLYVAPPQDGSTVPARLNGFAKVPLQPGEKRTVHFELDERCFAVWDDGWKVPTGRYTILVGGHPDHLVVAEPLKSGPNRSDPPWQPGSWYEKPDGSPSLEQWERMLGRKYQPSISQKGQFTMNDSLLDMKEHSLVMRVMYWFVKRKATKGVQPGTALYRMLVETSSTNPLRSMQILGGLRANLFHGLLAMANGRFFHGLRLLLKRG